MGHISCYIHATLHIKKLGKGISVTQNQRHSAVKLEQEKEWVGEYRRERNKETEKQEQRVECPSSHDIIQMALSLWV